MRITGARIEGPDLILTSDGREARRFAYDFKPGDYEIVPRREKRSLDANAYCWVLVDKLAAAVGIEKLLVYQEAIRDIGGVSDTVCMKTEAVETFCRSWGKNGLGWQTETFPSKIEGCTNVIVYYGSSVYDKRQMSRLIDHLVQDCKAVGVETMPPERLQALLEAWE